MQEYLDQSTEHFSYILQNATPQLEESIDMRKHLEEAYHTQAGGLERQRRLVGYLRLLHYLLACYMYVKGCKDCLVANTVLSIFCFKFIYMSCREWDNPEAAYTHAEQIVGELVRIRKWWIKKAQQLAFVDDGLAPKQVKARLDMYELPCLIWSAYQETALKERKMRWIRWGFRCLRQRVGLVDPIMGLADLSGDDETDAEPSLHWDMFAIDD